MATRTTGASASGVVVGVGGEVGDLGGVQRRADAAAGGRDFIDALIAGGFDRSELEVTFDRTQTDLAADSIQFSVRVHGECLIGQNGPAVGGYHSVVADVLGSGRCLVGSTRQID